MNKGVPKKVVVRQVSNLPAISSQTWAAWRPGRQANDTGVKKGKGTQA
jgi:hypothetical protein